MKGTPEEKLKCKIVAAVLFVDSTLISLCLVSFKLYDADKDGFISKDELEHVMLQLVSVNRNGEKLHCADNKWTVENDGR